MLRAAAVPLSARAAARSPDRDMALASTIVFFGVFPAVLAAGLIVVQVIAAFAP